MEIYSTKIMGNEKAIDLEIKIIEDCCGLNYDDYLNDFKVLTKHLFEQNFNCISTLIINQHGSYGIAYQVLGRFILLLGAKLSKGIKVRIIIIKQLVVFKSIFYEGNSY